jgi:hypothetical protein
MIPPHPILQVNVAEQLARSIVAAAHAPSPNLIGANEHGRRSARGACFSSLLQTRENGGPLLVASFRALSLQPGHLRSPPLFRGRPV